MAGKNDPSIYDDRSNIGSSEELDEYGVWVKSEPQDLSSSLPEMEDLPDIDDGFAEDLNLPDFSDFDGEDAMASLPDLPESEELPGVDFDETPENSGPPGGFVSAGKEDFPEPGKTDLSTQLLMKIADELSSIRTELSTLKKELSTVRGDSPRADGSDPRKNAGFFDEEDDEKIALTGDELDNILNTANFTEEAGSDAGEEISDDPAVPGGLEILEDLSGDTGAGTGSPPEDFEISLELEDELSGLEEIPELEEVPAEDGLDELREGVTPMLHLTEDTSYLDEDPLAPLPGEGKSTEEDLELPAENFDLPDLPDEENLALSGGEASEDFTGAAIDEPDLGSLAENPMEEPDLDNISIDLDMEDDPAAAAESGEFTFETEDMMEIPLTESSFEEPLLEEAAPGNDNAADAEPLDLLPEIEDLEDFKGIEEIEMMEETGETPEFSDDFTIETGGVEISGEALAGAPEKTAAAEGIPSGIKKELKTVLSYMDQLLESLPEDKIEEFAKSEYFDSYKKLFEELGLV
ncbi:MAG: hypothetical protein LBQ44_03190 [Treponema sp.]|jgi:hypothetical protein|nr:hypothetical protein [Treponema sp.]